MKMNISKLVICIILLMFFSSFYIQSKAAVNEISAIKKVTPHSLRSKLAYTRYNFNIRKYFDIIITCLSRILILVQTMVQEDHVGLAKVDGVVGSFFVVSKKM